MIIEFVLDKAKKKRIFCAACRIGKKFSGGGKSLKGGNLR